jgi:hypothetical protein
MEVVMQATTSVDPALTQLQCLADGEYGQDSLTLQGYHLWYVPNLQLEADITWWEGLCTKHKTLAIICIGKPETGWLAGPELAQAIKLYLPGDTDLFFAEKARDSVLRQLSLQLDNQELRQEIAREEQDIALITDIALALSTESNLDKLMSLILAKVKTAVDADAGSIYLVEKTAKDSPQLRFMHSGIDLENSQSTLLPINRRSIAGYVALTGKQLVIEDVRQIPIGAPYEFNDSFDNQQGYYTRSMMTLPMVNSLGDILGVIQLINRKTVPGEELSLGRMRGDGVTQFSRRDVDQAKAVASQAAIAIYNQQLLAGQKDLLESFIKLIADAIDSKSDYTGAHCRRVPVITEMLARAACDQTRGEFADFTLSEEQWYELRIAAWLHDCGKIVTPVYVMDKSTKLEGIFDRIELVKTRF